jgi:nitrous oxidase accessory protein NosD
MRASAIALCFLILAATGQAATYYVDRAHPQASDVNLGSETQPWLTIQHAADSVAAGDTVLIKTGTYIEQVVVSATGAENAWITLKADAGAVVTVDGSSVVLDPHEGLITVMGAAYVRLAGLRVEHAGPNGTNTGIDITDSTHIDVEDNRTEDTASSGIMVWSSSDVTVESNEIVLACNAGAASENECLTVGESTRVEITNNHVHHGNQVRGEGIDVKDGSSHATVRGNHVHDVMSVGIYVDAWDKATHDIEVMGNLVHDVSGDAFSVGSEEGGQLDRIRFTNNIGYNCQWTGISVHSCCIANHPVSDVEIVNNTFVANGVEDWGGGIFVENDQATGVVIRNNIVSGNLSFQIGLEVANTSGITVDHNLIDGYRGYDGETRGDDFQEGDPLFANAASHDYHLMTGSPAIDNGSSVLGSSWDYDGVVRPQGAGFDIGAFEFQTSLPPPGPWRYGVAGVAHNHGAGGTVWRSDLSIVNPGTASADLTMTFHAADGSIGVEHRSVPAGSMAEWRNVLESAFHLAPTAQASGSVIIQSTDPLVVTCRTYNQTSAGTFGQFLPGVSPSGALGPVELGRMAPIRRSTAFRTNAGVVNLGDRPTTIRFTVLGPTGLQIGTPMTIAVEAGKWQQVNDVVNAAGATNLETGFLTVEVTSGAGEVWAYASLVDNFTGDATTIPVEVTPSGT